MYIFFIITMIFVIITVYCTYKYAYYENFVCNRDLYYTPKLFRPYKMGFLYPNKDTNNYIDTNLLINKENIDKLITNIPIKYINYQFKEFRGNNYDYENGFTGYKYDIKYIKLVINEVFLLVKDKFSNIDVLFPKFCNKYTNCNLKLLDKRIISIAKYNSEIAIRGQLLVKYNVSNYMFLLEYIASYTDKINVFKMECTGIESYNKFNNDKNIDNISNIKIVSSPIYGYYNADKTYLYNSTESKIKGKKRRKQHKFNYKCYSKDAVDKYNCENIYDFKGNKLNSTGIWDRSCSKNEECPFYKKNKNYNNEFGKCINGTCELPLGLISISPKKYKNIDKIICHNCINTSNCCKDQLNRKLYPNLKSPDYAFKNDIYYR